MIYLLDTDTIIYFFTGKNLKVAERVLNHSVSDLSTSIINHAELFFGAYHSEKKKQNLQRLESFFEKMPVLPFCENASRIFAEQKTLLKKQGKPLDDLDLMIASIALYQGATLVTNNLKHFSRIGKLKLENWSV